jgi:hypothetical protein
MADFKTIIYSADVFIEYEEEDLALPDIACEKIVNIKDSVVDVTIPDLVNRISINRESFHETTINQSVTRITLSDIAKEVKIADR